MVNGWSVRFPENRPESGSARMVSDPLKGTRSEFPRTVSNPRTTYAISRMSGQLFFVLPVRAMAPMAGATVSHSPIVTTMAVR